MRHHSPFQVSFALVLLTTACDASGSFESGWESRSTALAQDLDGNAVYPDLSALDEGGGGGGGTSGGGSGGGGACGGGATGHLFSAGSFDYADHGEHTLTDPTFTLFLCITHFPLGSAARAEVEAAAALYNDVAGAGISVEVGVAGHQDIDELFPSSPTASYMDVVDNSTEGFPCHGAGDTNPSSWALNTCRHGSGTGGIWKSTAKSIDHFIISVNANAFRFDDDATSTNYPSRVQVKHELGHAFGMNHTDDWPDSDAFPLISVMNGGVDLLPSHDRGYLRHFYPGTAGSTLNLVASPQVRVPDDSDETGFDNRDFADVNPTELYLAGSNYLDCATRATPIFQAQWLNHGQVATSCTVKNRFRIGPSGGEGSAAKITIKAWEAAKMPAASQDRIKTTVSIDEAKLASLSKDVAYDLTFKVDHDLAYDETTNADDVVKSSITLRSSYWKCSGAGFSTF